MSVLDFQLLADYPDRQFGLAFDDISDDELRAALADTYIVVERLRERQGIESGKLIEEARIHTEGFADATTDTRTLEQIDLRPTGEVRQQTEDELTEQFGPGRWDKRANGLAKLGAGAFIPIITYSFIYILIDKSIDGIAFVSFLLWICSTLLTASAIGWLFIRATQSVKHTILPAVMNLVKSPGAVVRETFVKLIKNPGETMRKSWDDL